jgi:CubicO group peptidase (beta-lactamase class C family)
MNEKKLERALSPESQGLSSQAVLDFIDDIEKNNLELHSFMVLRHGKVLAEGWWQPYRPDVAHTMFSVSKSIIGTAIGFAIAEGKIALNTKVYELFPEYVPKKISDAAKTLTVEHLLTMTSGKVETIMYNTQKTGWISSYLKAPFISNPGRKFEYASENSYMLSAIIKRVSGQNAVDYLNPRLFEPLGIEKPFWETDTSGIEAGGWGLELKTEDMAKIIQCYLNRGKWNGRQVIPEFWAKTAGEEHIPKTPGVAPDHGSGYGYQIWRNSVPNSFRFDGVFSQMAIALEDYDACIVITGGEPIESAVLEAVWRHFTTDFKNEPLPENPEALEALKKRLGNLSLPRLPDTKRRLWLENRINGKLIKFPQGKKTSILTVSDNFIRSKKSGELNNIRFCFNDDYLEFCWTEKYDECRIKVGYGSNFLISTADIAGVKMTFASSCAWREDGDLEVWVRCIEHAQVKKLYFSFKNEKVRLKNKCEKGLYDLALFGMDFKGVKADDLIKKLAKGAAEAVEPLIDPDLTGEFFEPIF